ncbi:CbtB-domain containing protein [Methylobacterium sp. C25]|uniref:CbtB domain-containing protein n=1 Tax=Methylobacterium sp. C25 TaxID=2721622 RepID=UPI001F384426|nr:CbtB-domain containing protein [Methylobacterium sp. C25]MCE4222245.1 CbtB-domain containing protein [Methylobacterium sp. C25]
MSTSATLQTATTASASESTRAIVIAALLGLGLVFMTGFAPAMALHNAAHDFRHTQNFPCH